MSMTAAIPREALMRRSDLMAFGRRSASSDTQYKIPRTSQIIFGERQYLLRVLDSIDRTAISPEQRRTEQQTIERLIHARTQELNRLNPDWDEHISTVLGPDVTPEQLDELAREAPESDFFLMRLISEHPRTGAETLAFLARHPYGAVRENVARHPNADAKTLTALSRDRTQMLWYLVASNPSTPEPLRRRLQQQAKQMNRKHRAK